MSAIKDYYNKDAIRFWDPLRKLNGGRDQIAFDEIVNTGGVVLEYGFGSGNLLWHLFSSKRYKQCFGFDISEVAKNFFLDKLKNINTNGLELYINKGDDELYFLENKAVDVIVCMATIEHVLDPYKVLDELFRVAKDDAVMIISVPNIAYLKHRLHLLIGLLPKTGTDAPVSDWRLEGWDGMHLHYFTRKTFSQLLIDTGWRVTKCMGHGEKFNALGFSWFRKNFPSLFSGELIFKCVKNVL